MAKFKRLLITGATGALGSLLRTEVAHLADIVRVTNRGEIRANSASEEAVSCDLADREAVFELTKDVDAIIHMGGVPRENTFDSIVQSNLIGFYNVYEGARQNGVKRIVWGSSNHAIGFYERTTSIDSACPTRPDSLYGVSKVYGEGVAQYYFDKFGIETVSIRIGSCFPKPVDRRMLATWLSYPDFVHLTERALLSPRVDHTIIYGVSDNDEQLWDNTLAAHIGYRPKDNAEIYRAEVEAATPEPLPGDALVRFHGGTFAGAGHFEDEN